MEHDKIDKRFLPQTQKVGGYDISDLLGSDVFMSPKIRTPKLSFEIKDIININGSEILKITMTKFGSGTLTVRVMKYRNDDGKPAATFDVVDEEKKEIIIKADKEYIGGLGMEKFFFQYGMINQWEIPIFLKLCRGFVLGDQEIFRILVQEYNLKFSKDAEWNLKNRLGIPL